MGSKIISPGCGVLPLLMLFLYLFLTTHEAGFSKYIVLYHKFLIAMSNVHCYVRFSLRYLMKCVSIYSNLRLNLWELSVLSLYQHNILINYESMVVMWCFLWQKTTICYLLICSKYTHLCGHKSWIIDGGGGVYTASFSMCDTSVCDSATSIQQLYRKKLLKLLSSSLIVCAE